MLKTIYVHNFALLAQLELHFEQGLSVLTGETGAGKSIILDALNLVSGARADSASVGKSGTRSEVSAEFDLVADGMAARRLAAMDLDDEDSCILRRVVTPEGRSRAYVNGRPVPVATLREIGQLLVEIHGQHENRRLLEPARQLEALDNFAGNKRQLEKVQHAYQAWLAATQALAELTDRLSATPDQVDVWRYQLAELEELALSVEDVEQLESDHARLANADRLLSDAAEANELLNGDDDRAVLRQLSRAASALAQASTIDSELGEPSGMLREALIQCEEASAEIARYLSSLESDPDRFNQIEERLAQLHHLARKHRVHIHALSSVRDDISQRLNDVEQAEDQLASLRTQVDQALAAYGSCTEEIHQARAKASKRLGNVVTKALKTMGMSHARLSVELTFDSDREPRPNGRDTIRVCFSANPDMEPALLSDVASGGEISRVSLALKTATSLNADRKTLVFDEVDTGVSGAAATIVGQQLRELGSRHQVLCVTHLPQVAAQGHQHFSVVKSDDGKTSVVQVAALDDEARKEEIARLLGSTEAGTRAKANAAELLEQAQA